MNQRAARSLRGLGAGSVATLVAAVSHGLAGGTFPSLAGISLALVFSVIVSIALMGLRMPVLRLAASIVLSQLAFHLLFSTLGGAAEVRVAGGHHGAVTIVGSEVLPHASPLMWLAHSVAAALTIIALVFGERAINTIRQSARMLVARLLRPTRVVRTPSLPLAARPPLEIVASAARELVAACGLRGPPAHPRSA